MTPLWNFMVKNQDPWKFGRKSHFFNWPLEFPLALSSIGTLRNSMSSTNPPPYSVLGFFWVSLSPMMGEWGEWEAQEGGWWKQNVMSKTAIFDKTKQKISLVLRWIFSRIYLICERSFWFTSPAVIDHSIIFGTIASYTIKKCVHKFHYQKTS